MPTAQSPAPSCSWLRVRIPLVWLYGCMARLSTWPMTTYPDGCIPSLVEDESNQPRQKKLKNHGESAGDTEKRKNSTPYGVDNVQSQLQSQPKPSSGLSRSSSTLWKLPPGACRGRQDRDVNPTERHGLVQISHCALLIGAMRLRDILVGLMRLAESPPGFCSDVMCEGQGRLQKPGNLPSPDQNIHQRKLINNKKREYSVDLQNYIHIPTFSCSG